MLEAQAVHVRNGHCTRSDLHHRSRTWRLCWRHPVVNTVCQLNPSNPTPPPLSHRDRRRQVHTRRRSRAPFFLGVRPLSISYSSLVATSMTPCFTTSCGDLEGTCQWVARGAVKSLNTHNAELDIFDLLRNIVDNLGLHFDGFSGV